MAKNFIDGTRDMTERDIATRRYYQLADEQAWWNMQRRLEHNKEKQKRIAKKVAFNILTLIAIIILLLMIAKGH